MKADRVPAPKALPKWKGQIPRMRALGIVIFFFFPLLWPHLQHLEVPRLGIKLELQSRPMPEPQQCRILNPLSKARDGTCILTETMSDP